MIPGNACFPGDTVTDRSHPKYYIYIYADGSSCAGRENYLADGGVAFVLLSILCVWCTMRGIACGMYLLPPKSRGYEQYCVPL